MDASPLLMIDTASGLQSSITVPKVQPISDIIKNLEAIRAMCAKGDWPHMMYMSTVVLLMFLF